MPFWKCFPCRRSKYDDTITTLDHSNSTLTDVPPDVSQYERTLEELYLSSNRICALPPQLFYCQGLRILFVNDNELESLPSAIGSLKHLHSLNLSRNSLSTIPQNITSCKNLTHLDLSLNNLQKLPDAITGLISLQELLLNEANLEFLPGNFGRLVNLKILELRSNNLITLPKSMSRLINLNRIDIGANEFTELPDVICQLTQLRELWIDVNRIRHISPNISNLRELKHFEANNNLLSSLPNEISHWRNLEVLSLSINDLESLPFSIGMLRNLVTLQCEANQLRDLPDSICHLENLEELVINHNLILRLPRTIGMLRKLRFFCADQNVLRSLPIEICSCNNLVVLSVRMNKIIELPQNIGHLENLQVLNLVDNYITHLPVSVLSLTKLTALWISDNQSQPLVPLQYLNPNTKSHLTCFMLPQLATAASQNIAETVECSDNDSSNSLLHKHGQDQLLFEGRSVNQSQRLCLAEGQEVDKTFKIEDSTTSRICFADVEKVRDVTIIAQSETETSSLRRICFADEVKSSENLATRLMRSPTPYPKELRLMAKLVRNNLQHKQQDKNTNYVDAIPSAKTNRRSLFNIPCEQDDEEINSSDTLAATVSDGGVKEARILVNRGGSSVDHKQVQNYMHSNVTIQNRSNVSEVGNIANALCDVPYNKHQNMYLVDSKNVIDNQPIEIFKQYSLQSSSIDINCEGRSIPTTLANQVPAIFLSQPQFYQKYGSSSQNQLIHKEQGNHSLPSFYKHQYRETAKETCPSIPQVSASLSKTPQYSQQSLHHQHNMQTINPPPYHIARTYTKKSREDLLNYDNFHSKIQHSNDSVKEDDVEERKPESIIENIKDVRQNDINGENDNHCHYQNDNNFDVVDYKNNNSLSGTYSFDCADDLIKGNSLLSLKVGENKCTDKEAHRLHSKLRHNEELTCNNTSNLDSVYTNNDRETGLQHLINNGAELRLSRSGSATKWLFGLHKNPTVKQVAIKWNNEIGFEIVEKSNQGIFVRGTHPNTPASLLLHADDKLLEVNGYDFTKICLLDAQQILENSGPLINVMISRT